MALLSVIRRWHLREQLSIREIARRTGLSRNTIRKYLRSGTVEPTFKVPERPSKLDPFAEKLSAWLRTEAGRSRKQRRTVKQFHADLVAPRLRRLLRPGRGLCAGLEGGPAARAADDRARHLRAAGLRARARPSSSTGARTGRSSAASAPSCRSPTSSSRTAGPSCVRAYLLQTHEMLFDAHNHAFRVFGGVPRRGIYDNMKTAVDRVGRGKERQVNARFLAMASHYLFEPEFCNPASGWEKGQVEKNVQDARHRLWQPMPQLPRPGGAERLAGAALHRAVGARSRTASVPGTVAEVWAEEAAVPDADAAGLRRLRRADQAGLADLPRALRAQPLQRAGVLRQPAGQPAGLSRPARGRRRGADRLRAPPDHRAVARPCRAGRSTTGGTTWRSSSASPGPCATARPSPNCPRPSGSCSSQLLGRPGGDREMVEILALVLQHDEQAVLCAVEMASRPASRPRPMC